MDKIIINDIINGSFEFVGAIVCWINVYKILKDKQVKGVYWPATGFFSVWGAWNLYYYASLSQMYSFFGGIVMCAANTTWVILAIRFTILGNEKEIK